MGTPSSAATTVTREREGTVSSLNCKDSDQMGEQG